MTKVVCVVMALGCSTTSGWAADMKVLTKAPATPAAASPWDIAFGAALMSDYNFRGITQSNHKPSAAAYFEPRYNFSNSLQGYLGVSGESIAFPNRAAAEVDFYAGIRTTFGKLALDFGVWDYWYPGGECFNAAVPGACAAAGGRDEDGDRDRGVFNGLDHDTSRFKQAARRAHGDEDQLSVLTSGFL